jgi:hypothetical protein
VTGSSKRCSSRRLRLRRSRPRLTGGSSLHRGGGSLVTMDGGELLLGTTSPILLCFGYVGGFESLYQLQ